MKSDLNRPIGLCGKDVRKVWRVDDNDGGLPFALISPVNLRL